MAAVTSGNILGTYNISTVKTKTTKTTKWLTLTANISDSKQLLKLWGESNQKNVNAMSGACCYCTVCGETNVKKLKEWDSMQNSVLRGRCSGTRRLACDWMKLRPYH